MIDINHLLKFEIIIIFQAHFIAESQWSAHEEALALCTAHSLHQAVYFLHRDLIFMREMDPVLRKELKKVRQPTRTFLWQTPIWMPSKWLVRRSFQGQSEVNVISFLFLFYYPDKILNIFSDNSDCSF